MQQLPVMNVKPLMTIPIKRNTVIHYLLGKTTLSFFNFLFINPTSELLGIGDPVSEVSSRLQSKKDLMLSEHPFKMLRAKVNQSV